MIRPGPMSTRRPKPGPDRPAFVRPDFRMATRTAAGWILDPARRHPGVSLAATRDPQPSTREMTRVE